MQNSNEDKRTLTRGKKLAFALASLLLGFVPLIVAEFALRSAGLGQVSDVDDPFIGFVNVRPLFEANNDSQQYEITEQRQTFFRPDSFSIHKQANEYRIFCLGGSTVQGRPYAIETAFSTWLELSLQTADPRHKWEVVNCGGVSYASYRLAPIMRELLDYQPDMFVLYTGHNEFLEDRTYGPIKRTPPWIARSHVWLSRLRTYNALRSLSIRLRQNPREKTERDRPQLPEEVDALLDYRGGLSDYHRDDVWRSGTIAHFEFNLRRMVALAHEHGVPIILVNPVSDLKDTPPFKFAHRGDLTGDEQKRFEQLWDEAKKEGISVNERIALLRQTIAIDDAHAGVHFHLGKCYLNQQQFDLAKDEFTAAKDEDICPLRILTPMQQIIKRVARDTGTPLIDAQLLFAQLTRDGITGNEWLVDHVHPSMRGHQRLASALFDELVRQDLVHPTSGWELRREKVFRDHMQSLDAMYFIRGQQRLKGLQLWTQGRASLIKTPRPSPSPPPATAEPK